MTDVDGALAPAVVAVLGTLLGSALTIVFQAVTLCDMRPLNVPEFYGHVLPGGRIVV